VRIATELEDEILRVVGRVLGCRMDVAVCPTLFGCFVMEELAIAFPNSIRDAIYYLTRLLVAGVVALAVYLLVWVLHWRRLAVNSIRVLVKELLNTGDANCVQYVLSSINVGNLLSFTDLTDELIIRGLKDNLFDITSKAILLDALQKIGFLLEDEREAVRALIVSCSGRDLTILKTLVDGGGDYFNLYKLVYSDIRPGVLRDEIVDHMQAQSWAVRRDNGGSVGIKVLSDVDDTLYSSGGKFPAGCDKLYPPHTLYPGCLRLYRALDHDFSPDTPSCNLVFLSARPHVYKDVAEDKTYHMFHNLTASGHMHSLPTLLPGKLVSGLCGLLCGKWLGPRAWRKIGEDKFMTYLNFRKLYSEYDFVFLGDDGQGDLLAGQLMLRHEGSLLQREASEKGGLLAGIVDDKPRLRAVLIHKVLRDRQPLASEFSDSNDEVLLLFHKSYVGAAADLHKLDPKLVSAVDVEEVAIAAIREFDRARLSRLRWSRKKMAMAERDLRADLQQAEIVVQKELGRALPLFRTCTELDAEAAGSSPLWREVSLTSDARTMTSSFGSYSEASLSPCAGSP